MSTDSPDIQKWCLDNFRSFEQALNGQANSSMHELRKDALQRFSEVGFPTPREEAWKYTNITPVVKEGFALAKADAHVPGRSEIDRFTIAGLSGCALVFVNGLLVKELSTWAELPAGVVVENLAAAMQSDRENLIEQHLAKYAGIAEHAFAAYNTAFVKDGALIRVARDTRVVAPIQLIFITTEGAGRVAVHPRVLVIAEEQSEVSLTETYVSLDNTEAFTSAVTEVVLAEGAAVDHYRFQLENKNSYHVSGIYAQQARNSRFRTFSFNFGGRLVRNEVSPVLNGTGAECQLDGISVLNGEQHCDNYTVIDHAEPHCESHENYKGIYNGKSRGVFCGTIIVRPDAQKTNAIQNNQSVLLSDQASVDSKPQLKIWADDVKCTHGATVGQLDEQAMFYLRSRGIDCESARNMLIEGFASEVIKEVRPGPVREYLRELFLNRIRS